MPARAGETVRRASRDPERANLVDRPFNTSGKRLARTRPLRARHGKPGPARRVLPKNSQQTLADMVGTTSSRANSFMNTFRRLGLVEYKGALTINDSLLNVVLHE